MTTETRPDEVSFLDELHLVLQHVEVLVDLLIDAESNGDEKQKGVIHTATDNRCARQADASRRQSRP